MAQAKEVDIVFSNFRNFCIFEVVAILVKYAIMICEYSIPKFNDGVKLSSLEIFLLQGRGKVLMLLGILLI